MCNFVCGRTNFICLTANIVYHKKIKQVMRINLNYAELVTVFTAVSEQHSRLLMYFPDEEKRDSFITSEIKHLTDVLNCLKNKIQEI